VVDDGLHLIEMNVAAESVLKRNGALSISRKTLRCHVQNDTNLLHALVQAASRTSQGNGVHPGGALRVTSRKGEPLDIMVSPLRRESANGFRRGHVMILISDPASNQCARSDALHAIYGLTPAEAEVADLLVRQKSVNEISEIRGATMATVRTQIKSILSKADVNKQSEFVKSVAWMDAVIPGPSLKES